jgi:integral membrane protein
MEAAFQRYRIMAFVTGTTLLILCGTQILNWVDKPAWHHIYWFVKIVGVGHGLVLYPIYFVLSFLFVLKARLNLGLMVLMFMAGFVPGLAFFMEHYVGTKTGMLPRKPREESLA